ncbi:N-acetylmuramoyl-L-alanine amidase [Bradyrhizobium tropiciagri]|uniref:N-acetylmuramoyl-L-alanine amidase n=1 Tax=Bradyrhizobium tropiciagri TaxID=312253 RepID=UPI0020127295|nr:N-acetylmuramoyl-L-alanine amidase [Bradyrhizobium tropiciagri]
MRRCEFFRVLGGIVARFRPRRLIVVAIAMFALLPIEVSNAGWLPDFFKSSSKHAKSSKHTKSARSSTRPARLAKHRAPAKHHVTRLAALGPIALPPSAPKPTAAACDPATFRIVLDVGHTAESEGAISARNVAEFIFNRRLAQLIEERLKAEGFAETRLLLTEGKARPSLFKRVASASNLHADLLLSIHHDSVPNKMLEDWEFEGKKSHFSDRFSGYSVFVSRENPDFRTSLRFAELVAKEMKAGGLRYAEQYSLPIMGSNQHPLLNKETGVYSYDELIVLRKTAMPAVLLEAGSIINRDEELAMDSPERRNIIAGGVASAVKEFCDPRWALLGPL